MTDEWDFDNAEVHPPVKKLNLARRSILSVAFTAEEFAAVCEKSKREGTAVSRYVHDMALRGVYLPTWRILDPDDATIQFSRTNG